MPLTVTYFNAKGAAEITRLVLACAGVDYKDERVSNEEWVGMAQAKSPTGAAPYLTFDNGAMYAQSTAIARYCAVQNGLAGKSDEEKLHADMVVDALKLDVAQKFISAHFEKDEERKKAMAKEAVAKCNSMLDLLEKNCVGGDGHFLASGISWADLMLFNVMTDLVPMANASMGANINLDKHPKLKKIYDNAAANANVKKWVESRPVTPF